MEEKFMSLYDFLGKAAGGELGKKVFAAAKDKKEKYQTRKISNPKYTGKVILYRPEFLQEYFNPTSNDKLPF